MRLGLKILVLCIIAYSLFSYQKTTAQDKKESTNYPNKDSELAILMRDLVENTEKVKKQIINGEEIEFFIEFNILLQVKITSSLGLTFFTFFPT